MQIRVARGRRGNFWCGAGFSLSGVSCGDSSRHGLDGHARLEIHRGRCADIERAGVFFLIHFRSRQISGGAMPHFGGGRCGTQVKLRLRRSGARSPLGNIGQRRLDFRRRSGRVGLN
jgi:hypothetical protein